MVVCLQNQHDLRELAGGLRTTPFWKAIAADSCAGAVQVVDGKCTPPKRIWCVLEVSLIVYATIVAVCLLTLRWLLRLTPSTIASGANILKGMQ